MAVFRFLFALLLGFILGAVAVGWLVQSGASDLVVRRSAVVQDLERRLRETEMARDQLGRTLEDIGTRAARMEQAFHDLERRFHDMDDADREPSRPDAAPAPGPDRPGL